MDRGRQCPDDQSARVERVGIVEFIYFGRRRLPVSTHFPSSTVHTLIYPQSSYADVNSIGNDYVVRQRQGSTSLVLDNNSTFPSGLMAKGRVIPLLHPTPTYLPAPSNPDEWEDDEEYLSSLLENEVGLILVVLMLRKVSIKLVPY